MIKAEGLEQLTDDELRSACKTRGMKAAFGPGAAPYMRKQLQVGPARDDKLIFNSDRGGDGTGHTALLAICLELYSSIVTLTQLLPAFKEIQMRCLQYYSMKHDLGVMV